MNKPNFFIVGAPKCGTTSLYYYLNQHPDVFMPDNKEPQRFCPDLEIASDWVVDEKKYARLFETANRESRIGEASTWYLYSKESARLIKEFSPDAKIIIMVRNPVDAINSLHLELINQGNEDVLNLKQAIDLEPQRKLGQSIPANTRLPNCLMYTEIVHFKPQIERYYQYFGRDAVKVVVFDDFKSNVLGVYQEILDFLDVDSNFKPDLKPQRTSRPLSSTDLYLKRFASRNKLFSRSVKKLPVEVRDFYRQISVFFGSRLRDKNIDDNFSFVLKSKFHSQIEELSEFLNRDLTHWLEQ